MLDNDVKIEILNAFGKRSAPAFRYKILFLDVLFPLDVKKIIYVDADQVVRTDMKELMELDLDGAPYGYTPFCDSRTEMEGYRLSFLLLFYFTNRIVKNIIEMLKLYLLISIIVKIITIL